MLEIGSLSGTGWSIMADVVSDEAMASDGYFVVVVSGSGFCLFSLVFY